MKSILTVDENRGVTNQRLDTWLWAARFFKTRKLSAQAIIAGHVRVNKNKVKPGKIIRAGDTISIKKQQLVFNVEVLALSKRRLSAKLAQGLFQEPEWSVCERLSTITLNRNNYLGVRYDTQRPDRRSRKKMTDLKQQFPDLD